MISREVLRRGLKEGGIAFTSSLVERALTMRSLSPLVMRELEHKVLAMVEKENSMSQRAGQPRQVSQDQEDIVSALVRSAARALERGQISPHTIRRLVRTFLGNVVFAGNAATPSARERFAAAHDGAQPPVTMVISPTKACNLHCTGCYASSGKAAERLDWKVFDRILTEAGELWGLYFFTISGGEPLAYHSAGKDLVDMAAKHDDCFFMMYTNATLIDERMADRLREVGNLIPAISLEGFQQRTDERRGPGTYARVLEAMARLRQAGVPFGISLTGTRLNAEEILSQEFVDFFFGRQQAMFGWLFQYMPIGRSFTLDLLVTPEQRLWMWRRTWDIIREQKIMLADFWNCGTVSGGCIAAGREKGYLYVDWNGKIMPCVFVPYSPANIHDIYSSGGTLDDVYELPYFQAIRNWQQDYGYGRQRLGKTGNWLIPCSLRDHYRMGRGLINRYLPEPEDQAAADALRDPGYYSGMAEYDEKLQKIFDPIWETEYLETADSRGAEESRRAAPRAGA